MQIQQINEIIVLQNKFLPTQANLSVIQLFSQFANYDLLRINQHVKIILDQKRNTKQYTRELQYFFKNQQLLENMQQNLDKKVFQIFILEILGQFLQINIIINQIEINFKYLKQYELNYKIQFQQKIDIFIDDNYKFCILQQDNVQKIQAHLFQQLTVNEKINQKDSRELSIDITMNTSSENSHIKQTQSQIIAKLRANKSIQFSDQDTPLINILDQEQKKDDYIQKITEENISTLRGSQKTKTVISSHISNDQEQRSSQKSNSQQNLETNFIQQEQTYNQKLEQLNQMPIHKINIFQVFPFRLIGQVVNFDINTLYGFLKPKGWQNEIFFHIQDLKKQQMPQSFIDFSVNFVQDKLVSKKEIQKNYLVQHKKLGKQIMSFQIIIYRSKTGYKGKAINILFLN